MFDIGVDVIITIAVAFLLIILVGVITFRLGISYRKKIAEAEIGGAEQEAKKIVSEAAVAAENKKREVLIEAKEEAHKMRIEFDKEMKEQRSEQQRAERRLQQKEESLDKKVE